MPSKGLKGMWSDLLHFPTCNKFFMQYGRIFIIIPCTQSTVLAEKFADFEFGACKSISRIWQAEARRSYHVMSWGSLHAASLQATHRHRAKLSITLALQWDKSVIFLCSTLGLNPCAQHPPRKAQSDRALTPSCLRSPIPPPRLHHLQ